MTNKANQENAKPTSVSAWSPFGFGAFALLWSATLISNIGTWIHDVGAGWLMTTLDPTPAVVTLVQTATTLPIFLFALFAGTLADRVDKRRLLIVVNVALMIVVAALAAIVATGQMTPSLLVAMTFLIGTGAAFMAPAWQAIVPELVPQTHLQPAIALNSMGINLSRAIGPAIAGFLITAVGLAAPFAVNAMSHVFIIVALLLWRRAPVSAPSLPPEPVFSAMVTGIRHASHNPALRATMMRSLGFFLFASAYWALLPLVARNVPGGGAELYGFLLASIGAGAVMGALLLPKLRGRFDINSLAAGGVVATAAAMLALSLVHVKLGVVLAAFAGGAGWVTVLTSLNISAQTSLPNWVRARGLALTMMVFFGAMATGSLIWGQVATLTSVDTALQVATAGALIAIPLTWSAKLGQGEALNLAPSSFWPSPTVDQYLGDVEDRGPVMVTVEYRIDPEKRDAFLAAVRALSGERFRDGAYDWGVYQDAESRSNWIEWFLLPSWAEHLRQHGRTTDHDRELQMRVREFHLDDEPPRVRHLLAPRRAAADCREGG